MKEKKVCTQEELEKTIADSFYPVLCGDNEFEVKDNAQVTARENAQVTATDNARVTARENAQVTATDNAQVTATDNAYVTAWNNAQVTATDNAYVTAWNNAQVTATDNAQVTATDNAQVTAAQYCAVTFPADSKVFQSTLPRRERPNAMSTEPMDKEISIHAPTKGATSMRNASSQPTTDFNPRSHEGSDRL